MLPMLPGIMEPPDLRRPLAYRASLSSSTSSLHERSRHQKLHLLVAATGPRDVSWAQALVVRLSKNPQVEMRAIVDDLVPRLAQNIIVMQNRSMTRFCRRVHSVALDDRNMAHGSEADSTGKEDIENDADEADIEFCRQQAYELVEWADLLVLAPLDADGLAKMMAGIADTLLLELLRGWDVTKKILLVPGMTTHMWEHPVTKQQLSKIHRKWGWIRVMPPILWHYEGGGAASVTKGSMRLGIGSNKVASTAAAGPSKRVVNWNGFNEVINIIKNQAELLGLGRDVDIATQLGVNPSTDMKITSRLPPEIWTLILEYAQDWELSKALGIFTTLPLPEPWTVAPRDPKDPLKVYEHELEWTVLTCDTAAICRKISQSPPNFHDLSALVVKLVIRFSQVDVLAYLEVNRPDLFRAFDGKVLPTNASAHYGRTDVLDYWKNSPYFKALRSNASPSSPTAGASTTASGHAPSSSTAGQDYDAECINGASKNGFVRVLDWWWRRSGLPLRYTEAALEQASGRGHLLVLEWWRDAAAQDDQIVLRPGRSLLWAAQNGRTDVLRWWDASGIPVAHGDGVAKMASRWGRVEVLELWRQLKGDDELAFDPDVLVQPTIHQHIDVLEWWRKFAHGELPGMEGRRHRVEYRTCNIEEALEDSIGDQMNVRRWWTKNGLKLGLRSNEWMKSRSL